MACAEKSTNANANTGAKQAMPIAYRLWLIVYRPPGVELDF